jgi:hypothetical protein
LHDIVLVARKVKSRVAGKAGIAASYDAMKSFHGQRYTGMKVGRGHTWKYEAGDWMETKVTPDEWHFTFNVTKRRKGHAPEGSGVPVGTEYHWYILAHQIVKKLNANDYSTEMEGTKYKLAHRRADHPEYNISDKAQRKRLMLLLRRMIAEVSGDEKPSGEEPRRAAASVARHRPRRAADKLRRGTTPKKQRG